jgi:hypothetical protein
MAINAGDERCGRGIGKLSRKLVYRGQGQLDGMVSRRTNFNHDAFLNRLD